MNRTNKTRVPGTNPFTSRTMVGVICIVLALAITFGVAPLVNRFSDRKTDIVRVKTDIVRGQIIEKDDVEIVNVGSHNLPNGVITAMDEVVGKYATVNMYRGDFIFNSKLSSDGRSADDVLQTLNGKKVAVSVGVEDSAHGLANKLQNGDIVSIIIYDQEMNVSYIPAELQYVRVITATTNDGVDMDKATEDVTYETVTLLVTPGQAELLAMYNSTTTIHFTLVYRGEDKKADAFIAVQDKYLEENPIDNTPKADEAEENKEENDG